MKNDNRKHLALLFGGRGREREVSIDSAEFVYESINKSIYRPIPVHITSNGDWLTSSESEPISPRALTERREGLLRLSLLPRGDGGALLAENGEKIEIYCAFPMLHGDFGEDGIIQGALENANIAYVGCDVSSGAIAIDKSHTKIMAQHLGIPTARWLTAERHECDLARRLAVGSFGLPLFIKPARLGSSIGAIAVRSEDEFDSAFYTAAELDNKVLIEELVEIEAELECAYFATKTKELFTNIGEIRYNTEFYDYDTKYKNASAVSLLTHSSYDRIFGDRIRNYAKSLIRLLDIRDIARIDFFLTRGDEILFNEINTMPGFTKGSLYPALLSEANVSISDAISSLVENSKLRG